MKRKDPSYKYKYAMLLDDNELDNFINQKTIEAHNFANKIYVNTSSKSALEFLNNIETSSTPEFDVFPQIIFIDINMPMIDGFQFIENLKSNFPQRFKDLKIIILTSSAASSDKEKSTKISKDILFINKPLTKDSLDHI